MGRSYTDIKYDLWYNLEHIGVSKQGALLVFRANPGEKIFNYGSLVGLGVNDGSSVKNDVRNVGYQKTFTFPIRPPLKNGFLFSSLINYTSGYTSGAIFDTKRVADWTTNTGVTFGTRVEGGYNLKVGTSECYYLSPVASVGEWWNYGGHFIPSVTQDTYKNGKILPYTSRTVQSTTITTPNVDVLVGSYYDQSNARMFTGGIKNFILLDGRYDNAPEILCALAYKDMFSPRPDISYFDMASSTVLPINLTGTVTTATESDIVTGGKTIVLTIVGDTWVAAGATFDAQRQGIIDGLDSAQTETAGWNAEVRDKLDVTQVVRTSDTVVTITL